MCPVIAAVASPLSHSGDQKVALEEATFLYLFDTLLYPYANMPAWSYPASYVLDADISGYLENLNQSSVPNAHPHIGINLVALLARARECSLNEAVVKYQEIVLAAISETKSKFRLAEELALAIPTRDRGGSIANNASVEQELDGVRSAIVAAGGEPRSVKTLGDYRLTALWVSQSSTGSRRTFQWVDGASFTAHDEARSAGKSYEEFAANPRKARETRQEEGRKSKDGPPSRLIQNWTPQEKTDMVKEVLDEPEVRELIREDKQTRNQISRSIDETYKRPQERHVPNPPPEWVREVEVDRAAFKQAVAAFWIVEQLKDMRIDDEEAKRRMIYALESSMKLEAKAIASLKEEDVIITSDDLDAKAAVEAFEAMLTSKGNE